MKKYPNLLSCESYAIISLMKTFSKEPCNLLLFKQNHHHPVTLSHFYGLFNLILPSNWNCLFGFFICCLSFVFTLSTFFPYLFTRWANSKQQKCRKRLWKMYSRFWLKFRRKKEMWQMAVLHWLTITELLLVKQTHTSQVRMFIKQAQYFHTSWLFGWTNKRWVLYGFDVCFSSHSEK